VNILMPITVTEAMIMAGTTVAEPAPGEIVWVPGGTYALEDLRIRSTVHRVFKATQPHTGRTTPPEADPLYWKDMGPTLRHAPFDVYTSTAATAVSSLTYVLQPGFFNALSLYGLVGSGISVTVKDAPGGSVVLAYSADLYAQATGLYELLFTSLLARDKLVFYDIPISPAAELSITVTAATGDTVGIGMVNVGDLRAVIGQGKWGGTQLGVSAQPKTYSYIKFFDDGSCEIKRRGKATDLRGSVRMPAESAEYAVATIQAVLDVPVSIIATREDGYAWLNVFGLIGGNAVADSKGAMSFNFDVKGFL